MDSSSGNKGLINYPSGEKVWNFMSNFLKLLKFLSISAPSTIQVNCIPGSCVSVGGDDPELAVFFCEYNLWYLHLGSEKHSYVEKTEIQQCQSDHIGWIMMEFQDEINLYAIKVWTYTMYIMYMYSLITWIVKTGGLLILSKCLWILASLKLLTCLYLV